MPLSPVLTFFHAHDLAFKDVTTLVVSFCALALSAQSYFQRKSENQLSLRKQLTEVLEKITSRNTEIAKFRNLKSKDGFPDNYDRMLNDERRFFVQQATYLADRIATLTSPYEYLLIAWALNETESVDQAEAYFCKALQLKNTDMEKARIERAFGQFLFAQGRAKEGRIHFQCAAASVVGSSDVELSFRGNTYERWATLEGTFGQATEAEDLLRQAAKLYEGYKHPARRNQEILRVEALLTPKSVDAMQGARA